MRATVALLVAVLSVGPARAATFPGPAPCNTTLQACLDGAAPGDTVNVATNTPVDEDLVLRKTLTLTGAPGFTATIGTGFHRTLAVEDAGPGGGSVEIAVSNLTLSNVEMRVTLDADADHRVEVKGCSVSHGSGGDMGAGIAVATSVPAVVLLEGNSVASPGDGIRMSANLPSGSASLTALGNRVTTFNPLASHDGIAVELTGAGTVLAYVYSNVVYGVSGCDCRAAAGIDVTTTGAVVAAVSVVNNTLDDIRGSSNGIQVRMPKDTVQLTANIFNNLVTRAGKSAIAILTPSTPRLALNTGFNDFFGSVLPDDFGGYSPGPMTIAVDPLYVGPPDFRLTAGSPLVDAGTPNPIGGLPPSDADRNLRVAGAAPDIGAFELGSVPASSTSTTTSTSTTLPATGCAAGASYAEVACRVGHLATEVEAGVPGGRLVAQLVEALARAHGQIKRAGIFDAQGKRRATRAALGRALRSLGRFARRLRSPSGARHVPPALRAPFLAASDQLRDEVRALRGG